MKNSPVRRYLEMKKRAVVSERGTITIPEPIRKIANIHPGDLIEFEPYKDDIILRRLLVTRAEEEKFMSDDEWDKFEKMVKQQLKNGEYTGYTDFEKAKEHSRRLRK